jgi:hypothetical protein
VLEAARQASPCTVQTPEMEDCDVQEQHPGNDLVPCCIAVQPGPSLGGGGEQGAAHGPHEAWGP